MRNVSWLIVSMSILLLLTIGCDEDPVSVGEGILPPEDFVDVDTLYVYATDSYTTEHPAVTSGTPNIFAGETDIVRVEGIFRFNELLTARGVTPDTVRNSEFFDATLFLEPVYYLGDSTETISLSLYEVLSGWSTTGFTRDVFETLERGSAPVSTESVMLGDTNATAFSLSRDLIQKWAEQGDESIIPQGLIIKNNEPANGIIGFQGAAADNAPRLQIIFGTTEAQDTILFTGNARAFAAYLKDDIDFENTITMQAGTSTRSVLQFDLSELPDGALIHNAELNLTRIPEKSVVHPSVIDSLVAHHISDPFKLIPRATDEGRFSKTVLDTVATVTAYKATVSETVQSWTTVSDNNGFLLRDSHETLGFHRASFYTETAEDLEKRPRLKIIYSRL